MAYNPFNIFRRNQKALFAVLTVFIMIMFTLQSGVAGGDFFETFSRWMGGKGGDVVCKIDGRKVTTRDLEEGSHSVRFKRVMANRYMSLAANQSIRQLEHSIREQQGRLSGPAKETADIALQIAGAWQSGFLRPQDIMQMPALALAMNQQIESTTNRQEEKAVARDAQTLFLLIHKLAISRGEVYFTNAPNRNRRDLIDFMIWEKKADQLGIKFTRADVQRLIQAEFNNAFRSDVEVRKAMADTPSFTIETCMDALASEFKVRAAQTAVMGRGSRIFEAPTYATPYEMFEYYREQCSPAIYEVIPVPAAGFVNQVVGEPTEEEIKDLFNKYQNDEPNPKSETPGFKEPRKISVAYIGITGEEPYYKKLAEEQVKVGEKMAKASGFLTVPLPGSLHVWAATGAGALGLKDPAVDAAYNAEVSKFKFQMRNEYHSSSLYVRDILPSSVVKPGVLGATVGGFVGQTAGFGNPIMAVSVSMGAPIAYELRDRIKVGMPLALAFVPGPSAIPSLVGGTAVSNYNEPKPLPADFLRPELMKTAIDSRAKAIAFGGRPDFASPNPTKPVEKGDVQTFIDELKKLAPDGKPKDQAAQAALDKYIQDFITTRGLPPLGKSTAPRDEWTLEDDPNLKPLVEAQKDSLKQAKGFHGGEYMPFGQSFFWTSDFDRMTFRPKRGPATSGNYQASTYPPNDFSSRDDGKPHYVVWRTDDIPSKKTNLVTARESVRVAWKRLKARELALANANRIADQIRAHPVADSFLLSQYIADRAFELQRGLTDPKAVQRAKPFALNGVAPFVPSSNPMMMMQGGGQLDRYSLKETESLPYPTEEMQKALLENRDKPAKTVLVLPDGPKDTFYVATLLRRDLKTPEDFKFNVFSRFGSAQMVRNLYLEESMKKARQSVMELLKKEFKYEETEDQKKKLDENVKSGRD